MQDDLHSRLSRLENKIDSMNEAITTLARIDERMLAHIETARRLGNRLDELEPRIVSLELSKARFSGWVIGAATASGGVSAVITKLLGN